MSDDAAEKPFDGLEPLKDTPITTPQGIAAIALHMALKYHDIQVIKDGGLYQQYKLEGKNIQPFHLDMVFETAKAMEAHLMGASERIAKMVLEALIDEPEQTNDTNKTDPDDPAAVDRG